SLDVALADDFLANIRFHVAAKENTVRHDDRALAGALETGQHVQEKCVIPILLRWDECQVAERESLELICGGVEPGAPSLIGERRIRHDKVERLEFAVSRFEM